MTTSNSFYFHLELILFLLSGSGPRTGAKERVNRNRDRIRRLVKKVGCTINQEKRKSSRYLPVKKSGISPIRGPQPDMRAYKERKSLPVNALRFLVGPIDLFEFVSHKNQHQTVKKQADTDKDADKPRRFLNGGPRCEEYQSQNQ